MVVLLGLVPLVARRAQAAFVGGVETFGGNVLDTSTWQIRQVNQSFQNNGLTIQYGEAVTTNPVVPVGEGVRVQFAVSQLLPVANNSPGLPGIYLTTDSTGNAGSVFSDSFSAGLDATLWAANRHPGNIDGGIGYFGSGSGHILANIPNSTGWLYQIYTMEIDRPTDQSYAFSAYDPSGNLLGASTSSADPYPGPLYIDLGASASTVTFYNVTIVPEPACFSVLSAALAVLLFRRRLKTSLASA